MASLALSMVMMPTVTRTVEVVLRLVPDGLREAGLALGASRARMVWSVVLPTARSGLTTAVVLGIARAVGETAPLLFTAFGYDLMNSNPFNGPQESLPLFVYKNIRKPAEASIDRGLRRRARADDLVLALFVIARIVGRDRAGRPPVPSPVRSAAAAPTARQEAARHDRHSPSPTTCSTDRSPTSPVPASTSERAEVLGEARPPIARRRPAARRGDASRPAAPAPGSATTSCSRASTC